ncbi:MAG TPA: ATP-binding protein, partial [Actinomycetota bacterium]|nr:ATP-binding protein [Actinomycetota bacterium]
MEEARHGRLGRPTAHLLLPCRSDSVPTVRVLLHRDLERWDVAEEVADAILLAAGEAVTNAVAHGAWGQQDSVIVIRWSMAGGRFSFSVQDRG